MLTNALLSSYLPCWLNQLALTFAAASAAAFKVLCAGWGWVALINALPCSALCGCLCSSFQGVVCRLGVGCTQQRPALLCPLRLPPHSATQVVRCEGGGGCAHQRGLALPSSAASTPVVPWAAAVQGGSGTLGRSGAGWWWYLGPQRCRVVVPWASAVQGGGGTLGRSGAGWWWYLGPQQSPQRVHSALILGHNNQSMWWAELNGHLSEHDYMTR